MLLTSICGGKKVDGIGFEPKTFSVEESIGSFPACPATILVSYMSKNATK